MDDLHIATAAAQTGAAIVSAGFGGDARRSLKRRFDPVTEVDHRSEEAIIEVIRSHLPDDGILAEESGGEMTPGRHWIIDPLDGTVNFVHGIPQVAVSVALYDGTSALVGVVVDPLADEVFATAAGQGATLNGLPMQVSDIDVVDEAVVATGFPYDHDQHADEYAAVVGAMLHHVNGLRRFGSAALDLAWTAAGRYEGYWELGLAPWDLAAGVLLVHEAGGLVTDPFGTKANQYTKLIVAGNRHVHETLRNIVRSSLPARLSAETPNSRRRA